MSVKIRHGQSDGTINEIISALAEYESDHPAAQIEVYRQNSMSVRIRVVDPEFRTLDRPDRHDKVWEYLGRLPEDVLSEISMLLLLSPAEVRSSFANFEFEDPLPSQL